MYPYTMLLQTIRLYYNIIIQIRPISKTEFAMKHKHKNTNYIWMNEIFKFFLICKENTCTSSKTNFSVCQMNIIVNDISMHPISMSRISSHMVVYDSYITIDLFPSHLVSFSSFPLKIFIFFFPVSKNRKIIPSYQNSKPSNFLTNINSWIPLWLTPQY
jgi:hypothetical protein